MRREHGESVTGKEAERIQKVVSEVKEAERKYFEHELALDFFCC